jgi:hypothetical protein
MLSRRSIARPLVLDLAGAKGLVHVFIDRTGLKVQIPRHAAPGFRNDAAPSFREMWLGTPGDSGLAPKWDPRRNR